MNDVGRLLSREDLALCAHDLRGILTVIAGYSALLRRGDLSDADRESALTGIDAAIARADTLVGDVLAGEHRARGPEEVSFAELARRAAADERAASARDILVHVDTDVIVEADSVALARVLENLLSNATRYAPTGAIDIRVAEERGRGVIEVADRGPGIPPAEREHVFRPYVRLARDEGAPGSGLGLTAVRALVDGMRGTVVATGRPGGGTVVRVELPLEG